MLIIRMSGWNDRDHNGQLVLRCSAKDNLGGEASAKLARDRERQAGNAFEQG